MHRVKSPEVDPQLPQSERRSSGTGIGDKNRPSSPGFRTTLATVFLASVLGAACGGQQVQPRSPHDVVVPDSVTVATYSDTLRNFYRLTPGEDRWKEVRDRLLAYLSRKTPKVLRAGDYDAAVEHFQALTNLFTPDEFQRGEISKQLEPIARYVWTRGALRGDEGRVLSALLTLQALSHKEADRQRYRDAYAALVKWGREARTAIGGLNEKYDGLIDVWEEHYDLTPAPTVMKVLAQLYTERRNGLLRLIGNDGKHTPSLGSVTFQEYRQSLQALSRSPYDVAGVFLRAADLKTAEAYVDRLGTVTGGEEQLARVLRDARQKGTRADSLVILVRAYIERGLPDVALALCRLGERQEPVDPRFAVCLARIAAVRNDYSGATAWYVDAIQLAPTMRPLYDEALNTLKELIEQRQFETDPTEMRRIAHRAEQVLHARRARWPKVPPPVRPERLHIVIGRAEMNAGNVKDAKARYEASLKLRENAEALLQLGLLEERTGNAKNAVPLYRRALQIARSTDRGEDATQAELQERLGDAMREAGDTAGAEKLYRQALTSWARVVGQARGPALSVVQLRRGILEDRLGNHEKALSSFQAAMTAAPRWREAYAQVLSYLVATKPDVEFAHQVFYQAQRQLTLDPEWKVYFALWVKAIAGRAGVAAQPEVISLLQELAGGPNWWGRLAKFGAGELPYKELLSQASGVGEQTEAHFYEGTRLLAAGQGAMAKVLFERVLATNMVSFYEYTMAQELLTTAYAKRATLPKKASGAR